MTVNILNSKTVCHDSEYFLFVIGFKNWNLGFQVQFFGIRLLLIWWHVCIHF